MGTLDPAVAAIRSAIRQTLRTFPPVNAADPRPLVLVACSGGADSLALAAATGFVAARIGWRAGLLTVDHRLQPGAAQRADSVARWGRSIGLTPVEVLPVSVAGRPGGPEAAARTARYEALAAAARRRQAAAVLLGHTRDDQAETVLLALARGAGPRGLAGMPVRRDSAEVVWLRPLLEITRGQTDAACRALDLVPWRDPHNTDPAYARARVRATALPALVAALGERVVDNLARTAGLVAADTAALDRWAEEVRAEAVTATGGLVVTAVAGLPDAVRTRVLHGWVRGLGVSGSALSQRHVMALDALVCDWRGQGPAYLPGGVTVTRQADQLVPAAPTIG